MKIKRKKREGRDQSSPRPLAVLGGKTPAEAAADAPTAAPVQAPLPRTVNHHQECRLCDSTRRMIRVARAHRSHTHDARNCDACQMWSLVRERYNLLRRVESDAYDAVVATGYSRVVASSFS